MSISRATVLFSNQRTARALSTVAFQPLLSRPGQTLPAAPRAALERRFGFEFGGVRVHHDAESARHAAALGARAFTIGQNIYFGQGMYDPERPEGLHLIAHEAAHTVQQRGATPGSELAVSQPGDAGEVAVDRAINGEPDALARHRPVSIQRDVLGGLISVGRETLSMASDVRRGDILGPPFRMVMTASVASSSGLIAIPAQWIAAIWRYALANPTDGLFLLPALAGLPLFHRGGFILSLQPDAGAMTLDHDVFVKGPLSLETCVHELVHVTQYATLGITGFLVSYFGLSAATIAYRWIRSQPLEPMKSSPHENQAYAIGKRFDAWYTSTYGSSARGVSV